MIIIYLSESFLENRGIYYINFIISYSFPEPILTTFRF